MEVEVRDEHRWLERLLGEWTWESDMASGPAQPETRYTGVEVVRPLGPIWVVCENEGHFSPDSPSRSIMTLGYDPTIGRFVGSFVVSMMTYLWSYKGTLSEDRKVLTLETVGPSFTGEGMAAYRDSIEFLDDDSRTLSSVVQGADGNWTQVMSMRYSRKK